MNRPPIAVERLNHTQRLDDLVREVNVLVMIPIKFNARQDHRSEVDRGDNRRGPELTLDAVISDLLKQLIFGLSDDATLSSKVIHFNQSGKDK